MGDINVQDTDRQTQEQDIQNVQNVQESDKDQQSQEQKQEQTNEQSSLGWRAALEKDLQNHPLVTEHTKPSTFVRKAIEWYDQLESAKKSNLKIPAEDAPKEEWDEFFKKLGRPESPDEYKLPDGKFLPEEFISQFKQIAFDAGLSSKQAENVLGLVDRFLTQMAEENALNAEKAKQAQIEELEKEWGDQYKERKLKVEKLALKLFGDMPEFLKWAKDNGFYNSVPFNRMLYSLIEKVGEDTLLEGALSASNKSDDVGYSFPNTPGME